MSWPGSAVLCKDQQLLLAEKLLKNQNLKRKREKKKMEEAFQEKEEPEVICRVLPGAMGNK